MATIANNLLTKGLSGMLGKTFVFKNIRNKTVLAAYTPPSKKQSEAQKANRSKFRDAAAWAQMILQDPDQKVYYQKRAKKLGLPNAYTSAITDYMRKASVREVTIRKSNNRTTYSVSKKDFQLKEAAVEVRDETGTLVNSQTAYANPYGECAMVLPVYPSGYSLTWLITDSANNVSVLPSTRKL